MRIFSEEFMQYAMIKSAYEERARAHLSSGLSAEETAALVPMLTLDEVREVEDELYRESQSTE